MSNWNHGTRNDDRNDDKPPYSRIFVVCHKQMQVEDLRSAFTPFGIIEDIHMPKDRSTGESKGIAYIKYSQTSSAALAIRDLHLKTLENCSKPIKVMVATHKNDNHGMNDPKFKRLFIKVQKEVTETEILQHFSQFGYVESVELQKDKLTDECKGFAYVLFETFLDAAKAFEGCDKKYKAIFATPKGELKRTRNSIDNFGDGFHSSNLSLIKDNYSDHYNQSKDDASKRDNLSSLIKTRPQDYDTVSVICTPQVSQNYIERLFNIVPGMTKCRYTSEAYNGLCKALVTYETEKAAAYAVERLNNFEFPSGEIVSVKPDDNPIHKAANSLSSILVNSLKSTGDSNSSNLLQLADVIAQASTLLKAATSGREPKSEPHQDSHCSVKLPPPQPLVDSNTKVAQRCFLVFKPKPPPLHILRDAFCRFGDLIEVYTFPNKTFGFVKYASERAAQDAIRTLHGAFLYGIRMKVLKADEKPQDDKVNVDDENHVDHDSDRKRMKLYD